jgi:hypothetical protein
VEAYVDITRANGAHQTLGSYSVGSSTLSTHGTQLTFEAGQEKSKPTLAEFELHPPKGMNITQYGNSLVEGAKAYNAHPVRYDQYGVGGSNDNSFVSSLIVAKGGAAGLADVRHIASVISTAPIRTNGPASTTSAEDLAQITEFGSHSGNLIAYGFGHAIIEPGRFTRDATIPPQGFLPPTNDGHLMRTPVEKAVTAAAFQRVQELKIAAAENAFDSVALHLPGGPRGINYAGVPTEAGMGYKQTGIVTSVQNGVVTQSTGRGSVEYALDDLVADARDPEAMKNMLVAGREVQISVGPDNEFHVMSLERNHDLDRAQKHDLQR